MIRAVGAPLQWSLVTTLFIQRCDSQTHRSTPELCGKSAPVRERRCFRAKLGFNGIDVLAIRRRCRASFPNAAGHQRLNGANALAMRWSVVGYERSVATGAQIAACRVFQTNIGAWNRAAFWTVSKYASKSLIVCPTDQLLTEGMNQEHGGSGAILLACHHG